jgi:hypothetical protein
MHITAGFTGRWMVLSPLQSSSPTARGRTHPVVALADAVATRPCAAKPSAQPTITSSNTDSR